MSNVPPKRGSSAMVEDEEDVDESAMEFEKERRLDSKPIWLSFLSALVAQAVLADSLSRRILR